MTRPFLGALRRIAILGLVTGLPSCQTTDLGPPPPAADTQGRFNPDFVIDGNRYRLRGTVEHRHRTDEDGKEGGGFVQVRAHVEPWEARRGQFGAASPQAGAEGGFGVLPIQGGQLHFSHSNGSFSAGNSGIEGRLLECRVEISPPSNTRAESLDVWITAVVSVHSAGGAADGQRDIEIRIPLRWRALNQDGRAVLQLDPSNPASPFRW